MDVLIRSPLLGHIREYFQGGGSEDTVFVFAPYIRAAVLKALLEGVDSRIVVVTTWKPRDLQSGSSDVDLYPYCVERGVSLYVNNVLHLKAYSVGLSSAILATGNVSRRGMLPDGNYEAAVRIGKMGAGDRLFLEEIRREARLVDEAVYEHVREWLEANPARVPDDLDLNDIVPSPKKDDFLISALPMTHSVDDLAEGYAKIQQGLPPSDNEGEAACIYHDIANYRIGSELSPAQFEEALAAAFFAHPFIRRIDELVTPSAHFGKIKAWVQSNCVDVPIPSRRELTGNVQVLLSWFVRLGRGRYEVDVPGAHSQRLKKMP